MSKVRNKILRQGRNVIYRHILISMLMYLCISQARPVESGDVDWVFKQITGSSVADEVES